MSLGTEGQRAQLEADARRITEWGYREYGGEPVLPGQTTGGDVEEAANELVNATWDGDAARMREARDALRRLGVPSRTHLRAAEQILGVADDDWRI